MTDLRQAAQRALVALEWSWGGEPIGTMERDAITALKAALAQQAEPVQAVSGVVIREGLPTLLRDRDIRPTDTRLYTAPPKRKPLTEEEIDHAANNIFTDDPVQWWRQLARAVEAAHGIKEKA